MKRSIVLLVSLALTAGAAAKLPQTEEDKAKAELDKEKTAYTDKQSAYQTCLAQNATAKRYLASPAGKGKKSIETPPCTDPGPFTPSPPSAPGAPHGRGQG
ncbi:MAG TPA: hypothetical protein VF801_02900 [Rhodocyclaceae bacterium]